MISHRHRPTRHWQTWIALAALTLFLSFLLFLLHGAAVAACFVLLPFFFIGLIPMPVLFLRWDLLHISHAPDAPALSPAFQRPPPVPLA
jgi:hypothetical protein